MNDLSLASNAASEDMYKTAQQSAAEGAQTGNSNNQQGSGAEEVTDVPFEEVK